LLSSRRSREAILKLANAPDGTLLYRSLTLGKVVVTFLFLITVIRILLAIQLLLVAYLGPGIGTGIAYLAVGDGLVGRGDGWLKPLLLKSAINGMLVLKGVSGLLSLLICAADFIAVVR
jgi:hypothetical protein